jgi:hypothetical protein
MREDIFTVENGMRTGVPKIGILLTDGRSTSAYRTQKEANLTKAAGINILAVGIGSVSTVSFYFDGKTLCSNMC